MKFVTRLFLFFIGISYVSSASLLNLLKPQKIAAPAYRPSEKPIYKGKTPNLHQYANVEYPNVFEWGYKRYGNSGYGKSRLRTQN